MNLMTRRAQFKFSVEGVVELQQLTGKWASKYRYGPDSSGETGWMMAGTQFTTASEATDAVLDRVSALFPELSDSWLTEARASLSAD
jgi:hypothetical protein